MNEIIEQLKQEFIDHAKSNTSAEVCGVVVDTGSGHMYIRCKNVASSPNDFECSTEDVERAEDVGEIVAVFHSHINAKTAFTPADVEGCNRSGVAYILCSLPSEKIVFMLPSEEGKSLLGRTYLSGVSDCYSIVKDYYKMAYNINLRDAERWELWWKEADLIVEDVWEEMGFYKLKDEPLQAGDVLVMQMGGRRLDHLAVYAGNGKIVHHCFRRISCLDLYAGMWQNNTVFRLRNKLCNSQPSNLEVC